MVPTMANSGWIRELWSVFDGIFRVEDSKLQGQEQQMFFHWKYFDEANDFVKSKVGWYIVKLDGGDRAAQVAKAIDALSDNSDHETRTQSEEQFSQSFVKQIADIGLIVSAIMAAVFFTLLLLTGNTMAQAVRERVPELGIMKTLGYSDTAILILVLAEALLLVGVGGVIGLTLAAAAMPAISAASNGIIQLPYLQAQTWTIGIGLMILIGLGVGGLPALRAMRLNVVDALAGR